jgi:hypothetical protein
MKYALVSLGLLLLASILTRQIMAIVLPIGIALLITFMVLLLRYITKVDAIRAPNMDSLPASVVRPGDGSESSDERQLSADQDLIEENVHECPVGR